MLVGLKHVKLENQDTSLGWADQDYFSLNDKVQVAVATEAMKQWNSPSKDLYQYFSYLIIGEVLQITAGKNLCHQDKELCLFDDCAERGEFGPAISQSSALGW